MRPIVYSAILPNPSNVHALTGKQMASRIAVPMPQNATQETKPASQSADTATTMNAPVPQKSVTSLPDKYTDYCTADLEALILQMNNNHVMLALQELAQAYDVNNNPAKAIECIGITT